jgi:hypothetical protein
MPDVQIKEQRYRDERPAHFALFHARTHDHAVRLASPIAARSA